MILEEFAKKTLVGEVQILRNLLDTLVRILQQQAQFQHNIVVNPLVWRAFADGFDGLGEVFGGDAKLVGIPTDAPFLLEMVTNETDIIEKHYLAPRKALFLHHLIAVDYVAHVIDERLHERADQLAAEVMFGLQYLRYDGIDVSREHFHLSFCQRKDGMQAGKEEECVEITDAGDDIVEEIIRDHNRYAVTIVGREEVFHHLSFSNDDHIAPLDLRIFAVYRVAGLPLGT